MEVTSISRKRFSTEQIIGKLRETAVELTRGKRVAQLCKQLGITDQTHRRWRREYAALTPSLLAVRPPDLVTAMNALYVNEFRGDLDELGIHPDLGTV